MGLTGLIYAAIVVVWAIVLVPLALRRHDQAARSHSIERFSSAMRVLARRGPASESGSMALAPDRPLNPTLAREASLPKSPPARRPTRAAMKAAAARRRRVLTILLALTVVVSGVCAFGFLPWYAVAAPVALVAAFLLTARRQVRRAADGYWQEVAEARPEPSNVVRRAGHADAARVDASHGAVRAESDADDEGSEDTVGLSREALAAAAAQARVDVVTISTSDGGSLWDPLPITLPTYVEKTSASRSVRTIDLGEPGTWSAGHSAADSETVAAAEAASDDAASSASQARAANA